MRTFLAILVFIGISISFESFAKGPNNTSAEIIILELQEANIRLEEQNKVLKENSSDLRNSFYASLSFAAVFLVLFLGINVYFFRNRFNEDKNYLLQHIDNEIKFRLDLASEYFKKQEEELDIKVKDQVSKNLKKELSLFKSNLSSIESQNLYQWVDIKLLKINAQESPSAKLSLLVSLARDYHLLKWDMQLSDTLVEIKDLLNSGASFNSSELPELNEFLESLPSKYSDTILSIRSGLK